MSLIEIIIILLNDDELKLLLNATDKNTKIMPIPISSDGIGYSYIELINNGVTKQSQLSLSIYNEDLLKAYKIKDKVDNLIVTISNDTLTNNIIGCLQNGGGFYFDEELKMYKVVANYVITERMI